MVAGNRGGGKPGNKGGGRPAKPTSLKVLHGDRPDRVNTDEPVAPAAEVTVPDGLLPGAREVWDRMAPSLIAANVLTVWDVDQFVVWCNAVAAYREATRLIEQEGLFGEDGRANPAMAAQRHAEQTILSFGSRFGLTPSDRTKIKVETGSGGAEKGKDASRLLS